MATRIDAAVVKQANRIRDLEAVNKELIEALEGLYPYCHELGMPGETTWERAWLKAERALTRAKARPAPTHTEET